MRRRVTRTHPAPPRQSRAALRRVRSSARSFFSTLPPRAKWRPNWDLALAGKSLHNLRHMCRIRFHLRICWRTVVHPCSIREEFEGVVGHRMEGGCGVGVMAIPPDKDAAHPLSTNYIIYLKIGLYIY